MLYVGTGGTLTAAHKDPCASLGQNLMCDSKDGGTSYWFMTRSSDAAAASKYFHTLDNELDEENRELTPEEFAAAPFDVFVAEQKRGDLVLVPRRSCHQVMNNGGLTVKMSWSRMTVDSLVAGFHYELPIYRRVCRRETYRVRLTTHRALVRYSERMRAALGSLSEMRGGMDHRPAKREAVAASLPARRLRAAQTSASRRTLDGPASESSIVEGEMTELAQEGSVDLLVATLTKLVLLFQKIVAEEDAATLAGCVPLCDPSSETPSLACAFCGADIFCSYFECPDHAHAKHSEGFVVCPGCYAEGRGCTLCRMAPMQLQPLDALREDLEAAEKALRPFLELQPAGAAAAPDPHPALFEAACSLWSRRGALAAAEAEGKSGKSEFSCSCDGRRPLHMEPTLSCLRCRICKRNSCLTHTLVRGIHAVDVLTAQSQDRATDKNGHYIHCKWPRPTDVARKLVEQAEQEGLACNSSLYLWSITVTYAGRSVSPVTPSGLAFGFYDSPEDRAIAPVGVSGPPSWVSPSGRGVKRKRT